MLSEWPVSSGTLFVLFVDVSLLFPLSNLFVWCRSIMTASFSSASLFEWVTLLLKLSEDDNDAMWES